MKVVSGMIAVILAFTALNANSADRVRGESERLKDKARHGGVDSTDSRSRVGGAKAKQAVVSSGHQAVVGEDAALARRSTETMKTMQQTEAEIAALVEDVGVFYSQNAAEFTKGASASDKSNLQRVTTAIRDAAITAVRSGKHSAEQVREAVKSLIQISKIYINSIYSTAYSVIAKSNIAALYNIASDSSIDIVERLRLVVKEMQKRGLSKEQIDSCAAV